MNIKFLIKIMFMMLFINISQAETISPQESQQLMFEELYKETKKGDKEAREKTYKLTDKEWNTAGTYAMHSNNKYNFFYLNAKVGAQIGFIFMDEQWYMIFDYFNRKNIVINEFSHIHLEDNTGKKLKIYDKSCSDCILDRSNDDFLYHTVAIALSDQEKDHIFKRFKNQSIISITYNTNEGYKHYKLGLKNSDFSLDKLNDNYLMLMSYIHG
ncbi:MAG: hypothetical protein CMI05_06525 [Oceanospirillaceae bacterium]|nr:hypothetical protein [Oceanospirillaceae bacterium]